MANLSYPDGDDTTRNALDTLLKHPANSSIHSAWYEPGKDFCFYVVAHEACRASRERLSKLKLSEDEWFTLSSGWGIDLVLENVRRVDEEQQRQAQGPNFAKSMRRFVNGFCDLAVQTAGIVQVLLPQSPEYTMTYGLLFILFQAVVDKKKYQDSIVEFVEDLKHKLPLIEFYRQVFPTNDMKICVANLYVEILSFLEEAYIYCKSGRLSKLVDAVLQPGDDRLANCTARIAAETAKLNALKDAGHIAEQSDMREILLSTGHVVAKLYENMDSFSTAVGSGLMILNNKCNQIEARSAVMFKVQANQFVQHLYDVLMPDGSDSFEDFELIKQHGFRLAPRDHWDTNGLLDDLVHWSRQGRKTPLWIGGSSGNQDSWVTEFSVDFVTAMQLQPVTLLFMFCNPPGPEPVTQIVLIKKLIVQLLVMHPDVAYTKSSIFTQRLLQRATTFQALWRIFESLLSELSTIPTFIVLDRFEMCQPPEETAALFLPALLRICQHSSNISVIVTSVLNPPPEAVSHFYNLYIDTAKSARQRKR